VWDEESGQLHRELESFRGYSATALATSRSADGQQPRLVAGSDGGQLRVCGPEAGSVLHRLGGHTTDIYDLACIASPSAAPHHPRLVSASRDGTAKVWDGETGETLADLRGHEGPVRFVAVWKEHTGGHDRIATASEDGKVKVWHGEAFTLLQDLDCGAHIRRLLAFKSAEGRTRLLVGLQGGRGFQDWEPEEGRLLHDDFTPDHSSAACHLFESAESRQVLATMGQSYRHPRHPGDAIRTFLDVWDLGEAPAPEGAGKLG
jgi:WD40 repeat protein